MPAHREEKAQIILHLETAIREIAKAYHAAGNAVLKQEIGFAMDAVIVVKNKARP